MKIFICGDTGQARLLDGVTETLIGHGHEIVRGPVDTPGQVRTYSAQELDALIAPCDVAVFTIRHDCSAEMMAGAPRLRGICYPTTGVETLDLEAANRLGLIVGHGAVPGNIIGMAEATIMLMLMLLYEVRTNIALVEGGGWRRPEHHARQLGKRTIGLIGFGRIARAVVDRLTPFGARFLTYSPRARPDQLPANVEKVDLDDMLASSDLVCVLTGLSPETHNMIDARRLALMRSDAYLVNTGRGAVVDEAALVQALTAGRIAGAALDAFETEPLPRDSPLRALNNVILTPHCVGHTREGMAEFAPALVANIEHILAGDLPPYCKNPEAEGAWRRRLARLGSDAAVHA